MKGYQNQNEDTDIVMEQQNYIFKAWRDLKDSVFNVLYVLLDNKQDEQQQQQPMLGLIFESGLDYCQMFAFPFNSYIIPSWNGGTTLTNVSKFFSKFNIMTYLPGVSFSTFLIMLYALIVLIILVLIDIIYVSYSFSKKRFKFTWPLVILAKLVPLFVTIFFLPITQTLLSVVSCQSDPTNQFQVMSSFPSVICWKGWHLFHAAATLIFASLFIFISSIVALALFQPRMASNKITARQNSTGEVIFIMNKIICQLIFSFTPFKQLWVYSVMLFVLSGWLYWTYNMNDPFYNKKASKFFRILSSYYFWTNFMLLVSQLLTPLGFNGGLVIWISGLPFIGIIIGFEHKSNIDQLFSFNLKFKSGQQLQGHLRYVLQLLQNQQHDKNSYMLITGYIQKHKQICVEDDCPLTMLKKINKTHNQRQDINQKFLLLLERMYKLGVKKYPDCTQLRLSFAFFQLERLKNKNKAYQQFCYALKTNPTFQQQFIIYRFKKIIRQNLEQQNQSQGNKADLIQIIRFENHISLCEHAMIRSARLHKDFWTQLKQQTPDLKKLNQIGSNISKTINAVKQNYDEIQKINNSVPEVLYCYSLYLLMVTKDTIEGKKLLDLSRKLYMEKINVTHKKQQDQDYVTKDIETANVPLVCISTKFCNIGKILDVNSLFSQLSGYEKQQIVQRNMEKILPDIFKQVHEQKIKSWLESDEQTTYINTLRVGYLKLKSGFVLPVQYQVHFTASSETFTVSFENNSIYRHCCHLILDANKTIMECSALGHAYFGLDRRILNDNEISVEKYLGLNNFDELVNKHKDNSFEHKIYFKKQQISCEINIIQVIMTVQQANNLDHGKQHDDENTLMLGKISKVIGYYVTMIIHNSEKIEMLKQVQQKQQVDNQQNDESIGQGILQLYDDPNLYDLLITTLVQTKSRNDIQKRFELKYKIKTMRLLNNQIKMVYDQNINADFDKNDYEDADDGDLKLMKLNDDRYHQKIRQAINTKLNHAEITKLTFLGVVFLLFILGITLAEMLVSVQTYGAFSDKGAAILSVTSQSNQLSKYITATLDPDSNFSSFLQSIQAHQVFIDDKLIVNISLSNNNFQQIDIRNGYLYFYSRLAQFFQLNGNLNIDTLYANYIQHIYPVVQSMQAYTDSSLSSFNYIILMLLFQLSLLLSLSYLVIWTVIRLKIDKKKSNILLWFLDIPISYVAFLGQNCDNYLKKFISIKEVMKKGVKIEQQDFLQDYKEIKDKDQQIQQQQKARKTLILKQRKLTFLSLLKFKHLKMSWVVIFGMFYSIVVLSQTFALKNYQNQLLLQWLFSSRSVLWANSIHLSMYLTTAQGKTINGIDIIQFGQQNIKNFENTMSSPLLYKFNTDILQQQYNVNYYEIIKSYVTAYLLDMCQYLQNNNHECDNLVNSALKGGMRIYSMFLRDVNVHNKQQLRKANQEYGSKALILMLTSWRDIMNSQVNKATNLVSILFYIYIFAGLLIFIIAWLVYLSNVNTEINQAIRMLNMIPFKLLSSSRKQTRSFIIWIIKEANEKKHQL